jgi:hypothetical protein
LRLVKISGFTPERAVIDAIDGVSAEEDMDLNSCCPAGAFRAAEALETTRRSCSISRKRTLIFFFD